MLLSVHTLKHAIAAINLFGWSGSWSKDGFPVRPAHHDH